MMKYISNRGFTLIELLVVIAIIGILASVVLASLNSARDKGEDAAVKSNLNNMRAQAELVYDNDGRIYTNVCADPNVTRAINEADGACYDDDDEWAAQAPLNVPAGAYYCVNSAGDATTTNSASTLNDTNTDCDGT